MPTAPAEIKDLVWVLIADVAWRFPENPNDGPVENEFPLIDGFILWNVFSPVELAWIQGVVPDDAWPRDGAPSKEPGNDESPVVEGLVPCERFPMLNGLNPPVEFPVPA
jgi:hypothetical protein